MSKSRVGILLLFAVLFIPQCITVPAMYETTEAKKERRAGISAQYGKGSYTGLCSSTRYYYNHASLMDDLGTYRNYGKMIEVGAEAGASANGFYETSSDTTYRNEGVILQLDGRITGKIVTPTKLLRLGLKVAPGGLIYSGIAYRNGELSEGLELGLSGHWGIIVGIGEPEFMSIGCHFHHIIYPLMYPFLSLAYHHKKYSFTSGILLPWKKDPEDTCPSSHLLIGLGLHY